MVIVLVICLVVIVIFQQVKIASLRQTLILRDKRHEIEISSLKLSHKAELMAKDLDVLEAGIQTIKSDLRFLVEHLKVNQAHSVLTQFATWWKTKGVHEFEIVPRRKKSQAKKFNLPTLPR